MTLILSFVQQCVAVYPGRCVNWFGSPTKVEWTRIEKFAEVRATVLAWLTNVLHQL